MWDGGGREIGGATGDRLRTGVVGGGGAGSIRPGPAGYESCPTTGRNADGLVTSPPLHITRVRPRCAHQPILSPVTHCHGAIPLRHPGRQAATIRWNVTAGKVPAPRPWPLSPPTYQIQT
ncbi:hypothetical protein Cagg_0174 [Chloroflexus aggregans DSM 9485]|uniref:Uncharacterized protein n=1 Tax=Chloroflexus aggregans (strain MD-66 / DSM 9485) TaxID=326427 RepID=B8GCS5_CHLAD|nr:hypothetical protein Cagg_0174 [Chloroflexus aggregans DSM 9485]